MRFEESRFDTAGAVPSRGGMKYPPGAPHHRSSLPCFPAYNVPAFCDGYSGSIYSASTRLQPKTDQGVVVELDNDCAKIFIVCKPHLPDGFALQGRIFNALGLGTYCPISQVPLLQWNRRRKPFSSGDILAHSRNRCRVSCSTVHRKSVIQPSVALLLLSSRGPSTSIWRLLNVISRFVVLFCFI